MMQVMFNFWKFYFQQIIQFACVILFDLESIIVWTAIYSDIRLVFQFLVV
jgi:hypothetical protein